jgi:hypothetical protein
VNAQTRRFSLALTILIVVLTTVIGASTSASAATICSPATAISAPFAKDGAGDFCWQTATLCSYINSWNLTTLEVNGASYLNVWASGSSIAPVNGTYTIHYNSAVGWGHFEIGAPCSGGGPTPTRVIGPTATFTRTSTPGNGTGTASPAATTTRTRTPTTGPALTATRTPTLPVGITNTASPTLSASPTRIPTGVATPPTMTVRVFWLIPSDVAYDQKIYDGIGNVMLEAQRFYKQELGVTFKLNNPIVEVVNGDHPANWYETNPIGGPDNSYWWTTENMQAELRQKFSLGAPDPRWKVVGYISAVGNGGGGSNWVILPKHDADGAGGYGGAMGRWYGGMVHELGHAFTLPDATSTDGTPMSASFYDYPNTHFNATQKNQLLTRSENNGFWYP